MGIQNTILPTTLPSFPWSDGDQLDAVPLNNAFLAILNQIDNLVGQINILTAGQNESNLGVSITANWGGNTAITAGEYVLAGSSPYDFVITSLDFFVGTNGGSYTATLLDNGVPVPGFIDVVVENLTTQNVLAPANTAIATGDQLGLRITNVIGFPLNSWIGVNGQTKPQKKPSIGSGMGSAVGISICVGFGTHVEQDSALGHAIGASIVQAQSIASYRAVAAAFGTSTTTATGVHVTIGSSSGVASGSSTATGVGSSIVVTPTFVLDDPAVGKLDVNPLG